MGRWGIWKRFSFVGGTILYSEKSYMSIRDLANYIYTVHVTLINFSTKYRERLIEDGKTVLRSFQHLLQEKIGEREEMLRIVTEKSDITRVLAL